VRRGLVNPKRPLSWAMASAPHGRSATGTMADPSRASTALLRAVFNWSAGIDPDDRCQRERLSLGRPLRQVVVDDGLLHRRGQRPHGYSLAVATTDSQEARNRDHERPGV
jgi:hypothetical protein